MRHRQLKRSGKTCWICELVLALSILLGVGCFGFVLHPALHLGRCALPLVMKRRYLHSIQFVEEHPSGCDHSINGNPMLDSSCMCTHSNDHTTHQTSTPLNSIKRRKQDGCNRRHPISSQQHCRKRDSRTISLAAATEDCAVRYPISLFAELRGQCTQSLNGERRARRKISIVVSPNGEIKRTQTYSHDGLINCFLQCEPDQHIGLQCKWKVEQIFSIQIIDALNYWITDWNGTCTHGFGRIRYDGMCDYEWDVFYSTPYDSDTPVRCAIIDNVVIHNAIAGRVVAELNRAQIASDPSHHNLVPHPKPGNNALIPDTPPVDCRSKRGKDGRPVNKVKRIVNRSIGLGTPFVGDFCGGSWNAQSLFCECKIKANRKKLKICQILKKSDFLCIQETFATRGCEAALKLPNGTTAFWSLLVERPSENLSNKESNEKTDKRRGGLALITRNDFLSKFCTRSWEEIVKGKVVVLRLRGDAGALDIWCVYLPASCVKERTQCIHQIARGMQSAEKCLSVVAGDFNFTYHSHDRFNKAKHDWSGLSGTQDAKTWVTELLDKGMLEELYQPEHTHEDGLCRSRIDRVYSNIHTADFLDEDITAWTQHFPLELSHHRPVLFARRTRARRDRFLGTAAPLPLAGIQHSLFPSMLETKWGGGRKRNIVASFPLSPF